MTPAENRMMKVAFDRVECEGPLMVSDFDDDRPEASTGLWDWRPAKIALERLYLDGQLMISRTKTFQKVYNLPLNLVSPETDLTMPAKEEFARYIIRRTFGALGIAYLKELTWRARRVKGNMVKLNWSKWLQTAKYK